VSEENHLASETLFDEAPYMLNFSVIILFQELGCGDINLSLVTVYITVSALYEILLCGAKIFS